jgi:RNA recognition motif-containing protein
MANHLESISTTKDDGQKCRLYVGNLPKVKMEKEIFDEVSRITRGHLMRVITYKIFEDPSMHRGFCFLD